MRTAAHSRLTSRPRTRKNAGLTLFELIVAGGVLALIGIGAAYAFNAVTAVTQQVIPARERFAAQARFERDLTRRIEAATLTTDLEDRTTFFVAESSTQGLGADQGGTIDDLPNTLTWTATGPNPTSAVLETTLTFEEAHERFGPQGGTAEQSVSMAPVGDPGNRTGLYLREQRPADGDPTQGGLEQVFSSQVTAIGFEFWDGTTWTPEWDTTTATERRLPAAVRVTYTWTGDPARRVFTVRVPASDVTPERPAGVGGGL